MNKKILGVVGVAAVLAISFAGYNYHQQQNEAKRQAQEAQLDITGKAVKVFCWNGDKAKPSAFYQQELITVLQNPTPVVRQKYSTPDEFEKTMYVDGYTCKKTAEDPIDQKDIDDVKEALSGKGEITFDRMLDIVAANHGTESTLKEAREFDKANK